MTTTRTKKLILSRESAQFLLEGLRFFKNNPQAKDWHKLNKDTFLLLARDVAQFYPDEKENQEEYLNRFVSFLERIINNEEIAPSIPQNLEELVRAFESFEQEKNADIKLEELNIPSTQDLTLADWIKRLQETFSEERIEKEIKKIVNNLSLAENEKQAIEKILSEAIIKTIPKVVVPETEKETSLKKQASLEIKQVLYQKEKIILPDREKSLIKQQVEELISQARFLTVPLAVDPPVIPEQSRLEEEIARVVQEKTPIKDPNSAQEVARVIAQSLAQKTPRLSKKEISSLPKIEQISLTEDIINSSLPEITQALINPEISNREPNFPEIDEKELAKQLIEKISEKSNLIFPFEDQGIFRPDQQALKQQVKTTLQKIVPIQEETTTISNTSEAIGQLINQNISRTLATRELTSLPKINKTNLIKTTVNNSLPEIFNLVQGGAVISPEETKGFLQELTAQVTQPTLDLAVSLKEDLEETRLEVPALAGPRERLILNQLEENPLLPYRVTPQEGLQPLAKQMRNIVDYYGINPRSIQILQYKNEEATGLTNSIQGQTSSWWQNQLNHLRAQGAKPTVINQTFQKLKLQLDFEQNFPQFANFYQRSFKWSIPQRFFTKIISPATTLLKGRVGGWWNKTWLAKKLAQSAKSKTSLFFKKTLSSFNVFSAGIKRTLQEGAKKGTTKAVTWLAKKLAATKLGAALGSVAPGVGNAIGAIVGFGIDIFKGGLNLFSNTLQKITGGETEAEKTIKANLGPLGKIAVSPITLIIIGVPILLILLSLSIFQMEGAAFLHEGIGAEEYAPYPSRIILPSRNLAELIRQVAQDLCVPEALLLAISRTEASTAWNYSPEEFELFSTPGWWEGADQATLYRGYCYNTCDFWGCSADVRGIMQFVDTTFDGYQDQLREILGREPHRCLIPDSIYAAALKLKSNAGAEGADCNFWSDETVVKVARAYCGACDGPFCPNYCNTVLAYYRDYQNSLDIILNPPDNANARLAEEIAFVMAACGHDPNGYINSITFSDAIQCLYASDLSQEAKTSLEEVISYHINAYNTLQCVGFVSIVENLTGGNFPGCGQAAYQWGREGCWDSNDYIFLNSSLDLVQGGEIAVKTSSSPGHIGFISKVIEDDLGITRFRFVSAWGGLNYSSQGGNIDIRTLPSSYFIDNGYVFIRRK